MKSGISLFNKGVCKNLLRRCWPLWAAYLLVLIVAFPVYISDSVRWAGINVESLDRIVLEGGTSMAYISIIAGALAAMVMFSWLYSARSSGMMSSLPVRRETLFLTAYFTGLVPMLILDIAVILLTWVFTLSSGYFTLSAYMAALAATLLSYIAFYSFGVFCAMLTGSIIIMPVVYVILNVAVYVVESCVRALMQSFVFGMGYTAEKLTVFSPIVTLISSLNVRRVDAFSPYYIEGMEYLVIYCFAGIVLCGIALLLYRRRNMEVATDVVAIPILKPVFKYCMTFGAAIVFALFIDNNFFNEAFYGTAKAIWLLFLMFIGALIGYFIAEMLLQKKVRVFIGRWKGYAISCLILAAFIFAFEFDVFRCERHVPELSEVEYVALGRGQYELREEENIETALELHESIIQNKTHHERAEARYHVWLIYSMKDGSTLQRLYYLSGDDAEINDPEADVVRAQALGNVQEAIVKRCEMEIPISEATATDFNVFAYWYDEEQEYHEAGLTLDEKAAVDFYENYLLPDINAGKMGRDWWLYNDEYDNTMSNVRFEIVLSNRSLLPNPENKDAIEHEYFTFRLCLDAENCMRWLEENTDIEAISIKEAEAPVNEAKYGEIAVEATHFG